MNLFDLELGARDYEGEAAESKQILAGLGVTDEHRMPQRAPAPEPAMVDPTAGLLSAQPVMPKTRGEQDYEDNPVAATLKKMLIPRPIYKQMYGANSEYTQKLANFKVDSKLWEEQQKTAMAMKMLNGLDPSSVTPGQVAIAEKASPELGQFYANQYAAQNSVEGADHAVASLVGVPYAQWIGRSDVQKRADRNYYRSKNGDGSYFNAQLESEGNSPAQLQAGRQAEAEGTGRGEEITSDRQSVTGVRRQIKGIDQGMQMIGDVRELISSRQADPGKFAAGMRGIFGVETYEDGRMSAVSAQGVIDQLREVTLGAISESELKLLLGGLLDPSRSPESNLGTLDTALMRMESNKGLAIDDAKLAWGRLSGNESQAQFLSQASDDDWYYLNMGDGSKIKPIVSMVDGKERTVKFDDYYRARKDAAGPYEDLSRDQIVIDYRKAREAEKGLWEKQQEVQAQLREEARQALELEFGE